METMAFRYGIYVDKEDSLGEFLAFHHGETMLEVIDVGIG